MTHKCLLWVTSGHTCKSMRGENLSAGRGLGQQGTIYGSAVRESVADHSLCPGARRTLERFVGDIAAEEIFCLVECDGDAHDVAALRFLARPKQTSRRLTMRFRRACVCTTPKAQLDWHYTQMSAWFQKRTLRLLRTSVTLAVMFICRR